MPAVTTVLAVSALAVGAAGAGASAHAQKRAREDAREARHEARDQMMVADQNRIKAEDAAKANAARDIQAVRRRISAAFGRPRTGVPGGIGALQNPALGGKGLIGS